MGPQCSFLQLNSTCPTLYLPPITLRNTHMQSITLATLHIDVLGCILTKVIERDTYSIARLSINKHIYSVANEVWFAMVRGRLMYTGIATIAEMRVALCCTPAPREVRMVSLYTNDIDALSNIELQMHLKYPSRYIYTHQYGIDYIALNCPQPGKEPIFIAWSQCMRIDGGMISMSDSRMGSTLRSEWAQTARRNMGQMMRRILPELADMFTY